MKKVLLLLLPVLVACESVVTTNSEFGTSFTIINNTFGVNDFKIGEVGTYPIAFGSLDFGRNLGKVGEYQDSIGYISFNEDGSGILELTEQDTIYSKVNFIYSLGREKNNQIEVFIDFEDAEFKTYITTQPLSVFDYTQVNDSLWVYKTNINKYSGKFRWIGNKILK
jgi:hypothetical protein